MVSRILVPIDGSKSSHDGLELACLLAEHHQAKLVLLCVSDRDVPEELVAAAINEGVVRPPDYTAFAQSLEHPALESAQLRIERERMLARAASALAEEVVAQGSDFAADRNVKEVLTLVRSGNVKDCILESAAKYDADLIVMGSEGKTGLEALFDPSVAEAVRKSAPCPTCVLFQREA